MAKSLHIAAQAHKVKHLPGVTKAVLMSLAHRANSDNQCFPSHATLAEDTGFGVSSVKRALTELEGLGMVHIVPRPRNSGATGVNTYTLNRQSMVDWAVAHCGLGPSPLWTGNANKPLEQGSTQEGTSYLRNARVPSPEKVIDLTDDDLDYQDPLAAPPLAKARGIRRSGKPVEKWTPNDLALEFQAEARDFYPMRSGATNVAALTKNIKRDFDDSSNDAVTMLAMIDDFFNTPQFIKDEVPLWIQFTGAFARLRQSAATTKHLPRAQRKGTPAGSPLTYLPEPTAEERKAENLANQKAWLLANGLVDENWEMEE